MVPADLLIFLYETVLYCAARHLIKSTSFKSSKGISANSEKKVIYYYITRPCPLSIYKKFYKFYVKCIIQN